ncbi:MAG: hypothetical protein HUU16_22050 [Candidatus Omnitrophica bacterium]|nr:hypothetical protein [Candidatus Omnitrophota bacterium]
MTKAEKFTGTSDTYAGKVEYEYCLSCDGALSKRREYSTTQSGNIIQERRYEYDGLNLLRVDELYDNDSNLTTWQRLNLLGGSRWATARLHRG